MNLTSLWTFVLSTRPAVPISLPTRRPACFPSQAVWNEYSALARESGSASFNYCIDCTAEYKARMATKRLCKYPGTFFVKVGKIIEGRRRK